MYKRIHKTWAMGLLLAGLLGATLPSTQAQGLSKIPAAFVDIGFGARPVALGNAYVGLADDVHSVVWNPAGVARQEAYQLSFSYVDQLGLVEYQHAAAVVPLGANHGIGAAMITSGDDALRELSFHAAYGRAFGPFSVGVAAKYRRATFGNNVLDEADYQVFDADEIQTGFANQVQGTGSGFGLDIGLRYVPNPRVQVGLRLRDVVAPLTWDSHTVGGTTETDGSYSEGLPMELALGTVYHVHRAFLITADYSPALDAALTNKVRIGAELTFLDLLSIRGGFQQFVNNRLDEKYAVGFGLHTPAVQGMRIRADYTFLIEALANSQHLSLSLQF